MTFYLLKHIYSDGSHTDSPCKFEVDPQAYCRELFKHDAKATRGSGWNKTLKKIEVYPMRVEALSHSVTAFD